MGFLHQLGQRIADLLGEFTGRGQNQPPHGFRRRHIVDLKHPGDKRQPEGCGFAAACLRQSHHIATVQRVRDCMALDRGWVSYAHLS